MLDSHLKENNKTAHGKKELIFYILHLTNIGSKNLRNLKFYYGVYIKFNQY